MRTNIPKQKKGYSNTYCPESILEIIKCSGEYYITSLNNSQIRLGRDRYGGPQEGKGGLDQGACGAIDLFCGAGPKGESDPDLTKYSNPNFTHDAARVYISQRCDIDDYFKITHSNELHGISRNRSAVGMKADHVRLFAMSHMKLVTGIPDTDGEVTNSLGGRSKVVVGLNL